MVDRRTAARFDPNRYFHPSIPNMLATGAPPSSPSKHAGALQTGPPFFFPQVDGLRQTCALQHRLVKEKFRHRACPPRDRPGRWGALQTFHWGEARSISRHDGFDRARYCGSGEIARVTTSSFSKGSRPALTADAAMEGGLVRREAGSWSSGCRPGLPRLGISRRRSISRENSILK